ncbi:TPA: glycosyltransferase [Vibrio campbellii]|nr:glycosyltransferase [Vibrio campbellii]HDM8241323.1 glycosyltransferase [Vibrio campbellii]
MRIAKNDKINLEKISNTGELAPVLLFCYDRLDCLEQTVNSLQINVFAKETPLIIYSDGAKPHNKNRVDQVRNFIDTIDGFKSVTIIKNTENQGLANSVIKGVTEVLSQYEKVIVLEDDIVANELFLSYMNLALFYHRENDAINSVTGFNYNLNIGDELDCFLYPRSSSKSWGTWRRVWNNIEFDIERIVSRWGRVEINRKIEKFGADLPLLLDMQEKGKVDSWAIRFCINQIMNDCYTLYPVRSYVRDIGDETGTHACLNLPHEIVYADRVLFPYDPQYTNTVHNKYQNYLIWHVRKEFLYRSYKKITKWLIK